MKIWNVLLRLAGLFFLMLGSLLAIQDGFEIEWWQLKDLMVICGLVALIVTIIFCHWISGLTGAVAGGLAVFLLIREHGDELMLEWQHLYDTAIPLVNEYQYVNLPVTAGKWSQATYDSRYFLLLAALLLGFWIGLDLLWKKTRIMAFLLVACAYFSGMCVGNSPGIWAIICLVCGLGFSMAVPVKGTTQVEWKTSILTLMGLFFVLWIMGVAYQPISEVFLKNHDLYLERQIALEDRLLELTSGGKILNWLQWTFGGNEDQATLSMEPPRQGDEIVFEMTVEELPESPLFVKNFTSSRYEDGTWYADEGELIRGFLAEYGFTTDENLNTEQEQTLQEIAAYEMMVLYRKIMEIAEPQTVIMDIKMREGNTTLWPYFCDIPEDAQCVGDAGIRTDSRYYETQGYPNAVESLLPYLEISSFTSDYSDYLSQIFQEQAWKAEKVLGGNRQAAHNALVECVYSFDLEPVPQGTDVVMDFLFRQKKGYCMHFASAQALIWQSAGIPSRYASGYVVLPGDFQKNADGTYTAAVPQYRGHAWIEVYEPVLGWYPIEVTPPSYLNELELADPGASPRDVLEGSPREEDPADAPGEEQPKELEEEQPEEEPEDIPEQKPEEADQQGEAASQGTKDGALGENGGIWNRLWPVFVWVLGILAGVAALVGLNLARVRWIWRRRAAAFQDADTNRAALALFSAMLGLLKISHIRVQPQEDELVFAGRVEESLDWMDPGTFGAAVRILRIARFGNTSVSEEQRNSLNDLYEQMMAQAIGHMDQKSLFWYRFFHVKVRI